MHRWATERAERATAFMVVVLVDEGIPAGSGCQGLDRPEYMQRVVMCNIYAEKK
jgi:hypothetical protein